MGNSGNSWSLTPPPRLERGLGSGPGAPREPPACTLCSERPPRDRCPPRRRGRRRGLRGLEEKMGRLLRRPPPALQERGAGPEPLLLARVGAGGGPLLRMGAVSRGLKHPLARDTPVCLLAVLGAPRPGKALLLRSLLQALPGPEAEGWPSGEGALPGCRWGADSPDRGVRMWSQPFLLGKEGQQVAVFLVDTGDAMSPELSPETRTKLCALIMMLSSYQILHTSRELEDTDLECLEMFVHVAEVMGRHYGMVPIQVRPALDSSRSPGPARRLLASGALLFQRLDLLVRDSPHPSPAGRGPVGDALPRSGKYPRVRELLRGRQARRCLLPAPRPPRAGRGRGSPGGECPGGRGPSRPPRDRPPHCQCPPPRSPLLPQPVLSERPRRPRGRRLPAAGLRRRGAERGPPARQEPQPGLRERGAPRGPGGRAPAHRAAAGSGNQEPLGLDGAAGARLRLSGGDGRPAAGPADGGGRQAGVQGVRAAAGEAACGGRGVPGGGPWGGPQVRCSGSPLSPQDAATKRIFSALRVLPDTMRSLLSAQKDAVLARHAAALRSPGRARALEALEAELQAQARAFMDAYTVRFCGHLAAVGGALGAGLMGLAGGVVAAGAAVGATGAAVVGGGVGAGLAAALGCLEGEEEERLQAGDREPLLGAE
uniref:Ring finger protein 112 n=1 Tax=Pipistrellus kuhlii TaxID=59472 RepID=A0A7J7TXY6_PIPKU|nr:ring finger protein 112 [Pipistrellus kuhlii]